MLAQFFTLFDEIWWWLLFLAKGFNSSLSMMNSIDAEYRWCMYTLHLPPHPRTVTSKIFSFGNPNLNSEFATGILQESHPMHSCISIFNHDAFQATSHVSLTWQVPSVQGSTLFAWHSAIEQWPVGDPGYLLHTEDDMLPQLYRDFNKPL